ncbi:hypothetical protein HMPREF0742_00503 [Rothia aeria F0184]|uniref:Uncharacterized protein n=2 Tax=Rothia TaxID=32207 RepID=U7V6B7_9MICC|nr:hypothetical protein HMPREF0733_10387 [Rothia dentocariosa ATCC 17931]ERT67095.1 hypothetical protein HMPREF0742_00503 [Rothia aeria F0184]
MTLCFSPKNRRFYTVYSRMRPPVFPSTIPAGASRFYEITKRLILRLTFTD